MINRWQAWICFALCITMAVASSAITYLPGAVLMPAVMMGLPLVGAFAFAFIALRPSRG